MKASPTASPREEWLTTIAALYAISHRLVSIDKELVPTGKQRYPKLKGDEKALLYTLFRERCVLSEEKYVEWDRCMTTATQDLYNSRVSFKHLMQSLISKAKWARLPPLNQWAAKVGTGTSAAASTRASAATGDRYMTYMFNPALYSRDEITTLRAICAKPQAASQGCRLREGYWVSLEQTVGQRWDIGRLMAYLQRHLVVDFELEDLDECTPDSRTSTVWKLTMKSAECPEYLRALAMSSVW
ncbi:hypothetical protein PF001_g26605 [Phytophthora fragariae]|uniref:Uncharacterized protein n=1 Tax=Phytophthora fragariae TaxID=53985 RepID=A0A6A4BIC6_9STRA|nr:hypothetical protein PF001_g26605 [Phytophthora fragariae]